MTWPFENDTSAIVKKLAKRNVSSNRIFCFFNVLTIALAISLIVGISLFQQGSKISEQKILNQMQQATIGGLTAEQIEVLKKEPDLEDIVPYKHSDSFLMDGIKFEAVYMPTGFGIIKSYELVSGTCPEQYNEIVIDKNVQLELGYQLNIGDIPSLYQRRGVKQRISSLLVLLIMWKQEHFTFMSPQRMQNRVCYYRIFHIVP